MASVVKMRCPKCNRVIGEYAPPDPANLPYLVLDEGKWDESRLAGRNPINRVLGLHPVGVAFEADSDSLDFRCHRKCGRAWRAIPRAWLSERIAAGRDFLLP